MLKKWKQRAIQMNFKKAILIFVAVSVLLVLGFSAALYGNFKGRMERWESVTKTRREYQIGEKEDEYDRHKDFFGENYGKEHSDRKVEMEFEQIWKESYLSIGDIALIAGCAIIGIGIAIWYWLLCMAWAYRKSKRMGVGSAVWILAAFFFHLAAIAILYFYAALKGTCEQCGRIRPGGSKYCDRCGKPFAKECPDCGQAVDIKAGYCGNCGKKLNENEEV